MGTNWRPGDERSDGRISARGIRRGMRLKRRRKLVVVLAVLAMIFLALLTVGLPLTSG